MLLQTKVWGKMYLLRSTLDSSASFLVCSVFWILSLSFYFKFIVYYSNYAKTGKVKILSLTTT